MFYAKKLPKMTQKNKFSLFFPFLQ